MVTEALLKEIGVLDEDISLILEQNSIYVDKIKPLACEYQKTLGHEPFLPYCSDKEKEEAYERAVRYSEKVMELNANNYHMLHLLAWLNLVPGLKRRYEELGIAYDVFLSTMKNIVYKIAECKTVYGTPGVFTDYFFVDFDLKLFELGRLQYEAFRFTGKSYVFGDTVIKDGDTVYFCHIPSSGKLTYELCMESMQMAYEFFKDRLECHVIPVFCQSWLLYERYINEVYPEGSNLKKFAGMFDLYDNQPSEFADCWRVFGKMYEGSTEGLPTDTTLRRKFVEYINAGGTFGRGYGVILYDGEKKEIINRR